VAERIELTYAQRATQLRRLREQVDALERTLWEIAAESCDAGAPVDLVAEALGVSVATWYRRRPN
jgi:hypothetical protein